MKLCQQIGSGVLEVALVNTYKLFNMVWMTNYITYCTTKRKETDGERAQMKKDEKDTRFPKTVSLANSVIGHEDGTENWINT